MGVLATSAPEFESFLTRIKDDRGLGPVAGAAPQNARFIPRNFLLEERLEPDRVSSYGSFCLLAGRLDSTSGTPLTISI
jgi:hypothetical protein